MANSETPKTPMTRQHLMQRQADEQSQVTKSRGWLEAGEGVVVVEAVDGLRCHS